MGHKGSKIDKYAITLTGIGTNPNWTIEEVGNNLILSPYPSKPNSSFPDKCSISGRYDISSSTLYYTYKCTKPPSEAKVTLPNCVYQTSSSSISCPNTSDSAALFNRIKASAVNVQNYSRDILDEDIGSIDEFQEIPSNQLSGVARTDNSWLWILLIFIIFIFLVILARKNNK
jgi:hypothetical protein